MGSRLTEIEYPSSDGEPMGESTIHVKIIMDLFMNLQSQMKRRVDGKGFVAANLFWYPVQGDPTIVLAPDVMVVPTRPAGDRDCYKQWEEENTPPACVFEIVSKSNRSAEMKGKLKFYDEYGVSVYVIYDPLRNVLQIYVRDELTSSLKAVSKLDGWVSPVLGISYHEQSDFWEVRDLEGKSFESSSSIVNAKRDQEKLLEQERTRRNAERDQLEAERRDKELALKSAEAERERADSEQQAKEKLAAKLRELGIDPEKL